MTYEKTKNKEAFEAQKINFEATYQDIQRNICNELDKAHIYGYIVENTNEYVIVSVWDENEYTDKLYKYNISIDEDGKVTLGDGFEVRIEYVAKMEEQTPAPVDEPAPAPTEEPTPAPTDEPTTTTVEEQTPEPQATEKEVELNKEIEALKAKIAELESKPAANPPTEDFENIKNTLNTKTGVSSLDKLASRLRQGF